MRPLLVHMHGIHMLNWSSWKRAGLTHPLLRAWSRYRFPTWRAQVPAPLRQAVSGARVLVVGVYLGRRPNLAADIARELAGAADLEVVQAWIALGQISADPLLRSLTTSTVTQRIPKFTLLNAVLQGVDLSSFDFLLVSDDDVALPADFLHGYLALQQACDFALAQPARTLHSHHDHYLTLQRPWLVARRTRFVEIGPVFSLRADAFQRLLPFSEASPMGWGYDHVWPKLMERAGLAMGIIDRTPVDHSLRPQSNTSSAAAELAVMRRYLAGRPHMAQPSATAGLARIWRMSALPVLPLSARRAGPPPGDDAAALARISAELRAGSELHPDAALDTTGAPGVPVVPSVTRVTAEPSA
ncbi:MAG: hypothetical protein RLY71_1778 [Pseudomonadota bacterium]